MMPATEQRKYDWRLIAVCLTLFFGTLLIFNRTLQNGFLDLDDPDYVTQNAHVKHGLSFEGIRWAFTTGDSANWHPLTWVSLLVDAQLYGDYAGGFHFTNNVLHALNAVLAFLALWRLMRFRDDGAVTFWSCALCAALFAWHPLRVESVAWVAERKDVLSGLFFWLTLMAYTAYVWHSTVRNPRSRVCYVGALVLFACGLMSKPMLVTVPFLLLLLDFWPMQRFVIYDLRRSIFKLLVEKIPFLSLSVASCIVTFIVQKNWGAVVDSQPFGTRLANALVSIVRYAGNLFWPHDLAIVYPLPSHWPIAIVIPSALAVGCVTVFAILRLRQQPWIFVGWFWFVGMLMPVIGIVQVGLQSMADRYTYLPMVGLQLALIWTLRELRIPSLSPLKPLAAVVLLAACVVLTQYQIAFWRSPKSLYEHALSVTKDNYLAECYLGTALLTDDSFADAETHFRRAIACRPDFSDARFKLAVALAKSGNDSEAIVGYQELLKRNPKHVPAEYNYGISLLNQNRVAEAIPHFQHALAMKPDYDPASIALGTAEAKLGKTESAISYFQKAIAIKPDNAIAEYNFANVLTDLHRERDALPHYERALALDPDFEEAHCNYANALGTLGRPTEALGHFRRALMLNPQNAAACFGLAVAFEDLGRIPEAMAGYERTIAVDSGNATAHYNLATIFLNQSRWTNALFQFRAVARIQPRNNSAFLGAGLAEERIGRTNDAVADYRRAVELAPQDAQAHCCLGIALRRAGNYAEAVVEEESALRLNPDFPGLREQLAMAKREEASQ